MKRIFCVILILALAGCSPQSTSSEPKKTVETKEFTRGVWLSFSEINELLESGFDFSGLTKNLKTLGITDLYIHTRSHCDSIVPSDLFPQTESSRAVKFNILEKVISECHNADIKVHAWINPYRVASSHSDITKLDLNSPAVEWLNDNDTDNDKNVIIMNGIYLNPAEPQVRRLILDGIKELIEGYAIDGIHFDDYFYPTTDSEFDRISYEAYKTDTPHPLSLDDWRRTNIDILIADCKKLIEISGKDIIFSISPAADIDKNYSSYYADIKGWCEKGLIDRVIPQLYFGFEHTDSEFNFDRLLNDWLQLCDYSKTQLKIGLASYKIGTGSPADGTEWQENSDILAKQIKLCKTKPQISGAVFFSYNSLFSTEMANTAERENLIT